MIVVDVSSSRSDNICTVEKISEPRMIENKDQGEQDVRLQG